MRHHPIVRAAQIRSDTDQTVFKIHKGVKTFDLSTAKNVLVTGGMDRVVRLWNPYLPARPIARLRGHNAPVFLVKIAVEDNRLFSISADKTVMVSFHLFSFSWSITIHCFLLQKILTIQQEKTIFELFFANLFFWSVNHKQVHFSVVEVLLVQRVEH